MRAIVEYLPGAPPLLRIFVHGAPHRRQHIEVIRAYRRELVAAALASGIDVPIWEAVDLRVTFINPCSTDLDNLLVALYRSLDGKAHAAPTVLVDDGLIQRVTMDLLFPNAHETARGEDRGALRLVA